MQRQPAAPLCCRQLAWESGSGMRLPGAVPMGRGASGVALLSRKPLHRNSLAAGNGAGIFIQCWAGPKWQLVDVFHPVAMLQKEGLLLGFLDSLGS